MAKIEVNALTQLEYEYNVIYKFPLKIVERQAIPMPRHAHVLSVASQDDQLCLWAACDQGERLIDREFVIISTGGNLQDDLGRFIGTVTVRLFVWHVFEVKEVT